MASLSPEHDDKPTQYEWSKFKEAGLLTEQDTNLLASIKIAKETPEIVKAITERPQEYITLFMKILYSTTQDEPIKFILYMVELACAESEKFVKDLYEVQRLHQLGITPVQFEPMKAYMRLLHKSDIYILEKTFKTLSRFFNMDFKAQVAPVALNGEDTRATIHVQSENSDLENYVDVITRILHQAVKEAEENSQHGNTEHSIKLGRMGVNALASLMKRDECREMFYKSDGIPTLIQLLKCFRDNVQMLYEVCFCIWCLSFNKKIASFFPQNSIIPRLHDVLIRVMKEKVLRVVILTFKNLLSFSSFVDEMIRFGVPKTLQNLLKRKFQDPDIQDQIKQLSDLLEQHIEEISSFDEYRQEVLSGNLKWSPVHTSEKFWKESMAKIEQNNFFILRELVKVLDSKAAQVTDEAELHAMQQPTRTQSLSPGGFGEGQQQQDIVGSIDEFRNLAIACHDIGQFVRYHPRGKKIVTDLGAKTKVLVLMEHPHQEVKKHALLCVQKIMVQQWEFL